MDQGPSGIAFNGSKNENEFDDGQPCLDDAEEGLAMCHLKNNFCCEILRTGWTSNKHVTTVWTLVTGRSGTLRVVFREVEPKANRNLKGSCTLP